MSGGHSPEISRATATGHGLLFGAGGSGNNWAGGLFPERPLTEAGGFAHKLSLRHRRNAGLGDLHTLDIAGGYHQYAGSALHIRRLSAVRLFAIPVRPGRPHANALKEGGRLTA